MKNDAEVSRNDASNVTSLADHLHDKRAACRMIGGNAKPISLRTLEKLMSTRRIKFHRIGGLVRFHTDDILAYMESVARPALDQRKAS